jgi:hypothetical protein
MRVAIPSVALAVLLVVGCGARFGSGYSMHDTALFADSPHIAVHSKSPTGTTYGLRWQYGTTGFFFQPRGKIVNGQLCFSLQVSSSSGSLSGRYSEIPISDPKMIQALQKEGAFWLEPDGQRIRLEERRL